MNQLEASTRTAAAIKRLQEASPGGLLLWTFFTIVGAMWRGLIHLCIGFGSASLAGISAWWGLPIMLVSTLTLGRAWSWWRRDARVRSLEELADEAEKAKTA